MTARGRAWVLALSACMTLALGGCDRIHRLLHGPGFDTAKLESALDPAIGGPDTCVLIKDTASGETLYRYGDHAVCDRPLAPCATFNAPMALIGLDEGKIAPGAPWPWDGSPQQAEAWRKPTDLAAAFQWNTPWWWRRLAGAIGPREFARRLPAFGYGAGQPVGDPLAFWQGPAAGGGLFVSTNDQADFLRRLYTGALPVTAAASASVQGLMVEETRGDTTLSGLIGSCPSNADASRSLGWWVGRIKSPRRDLIFAISIEGERAIPGLEIRNRITPILTQVGLLPAG